MGNFRIVKDVNIGGAAISKNEADTIEMTKRSMSSAK
jgi:hypothetical protein